MYIQIFFISLLLLFLVSCAPTFNLLDPRFNASGEGDKTIVGSIEERNNHLFIASPMTRVDERTVLVDGPEGRTTWKVGHGIRVRLAGEDALVHNADSGWTLPPGALAGASVSHDRMDKMEGEASVRCTFTGMPPDIDGDGAPDPVGLCEVDLGGPIDLGFDELGFWIKSSVATNVADLRIRILRFDDPLDPNDCAAPIVHGRCPTFELDIPALNANVWTKVFVELKRSAGNGIVDHFSGGHRIVTLECRKQCDGIEVHLDDIWLVKDLVATVDEIQRMPGGEATFRLNRAAGRTVSNEVVYHDDTAALTSWVQTANRPGGANLFAPAGVYYMSNVGLPGVGGLEGSLSLPLYNYTHIRGAGPNKTTFKNTGRSGTGPGVMFRSAAPAPVKIVIKNCGFDWNGWNLQDFATVILISPQTTSEVARNIHIRRNRFFDSDLPGTVGCDFGQDECVPRQRHHVLVQRVDGVWVENNQMSGGGRIKTGGGGLGRNMYIRNNVLDFVNDNGITIVDGVPGTTEHVEITDNTIIDPVTSGIFFGGDGEEAADVPGMIVQDVTIARNRISGFWATAGIIGTLPLNVAEVRILKNVVQTVRDTPIRPGFQFVTGIILKRGSSATELATGVRVEGNTVLASGTHAVYNVGAIVLGGLTRGLTVGNNEVRCDGCSGIERGIVLSGRVHENIMLHNNRVVGAGIALHLGYLASGLTITNADISGNEFLASTSSSGQITIDTNPGETVEARIERNRIHGGAAWGILCRGDGTFLLMGLLTNDFAGNARGDISGCR